MLTIVVQCVSVRIANTSVNTSTQGYNAPITSVCVYVLAEVGGSKLAVFVELRMRNHEVLCYGAAS